MTCGPSGPLLPTRHAKWRGRPSWQELWERAPFGHILHHFELPHGVRRAGGDQETPSSDRGWIRRGVKQAQLQGNTREATTLTVAISMDRGPLDMLVQIVPAGKTDAVLQEQPWPEHTRHVTFENG